MVAVDDDAKTRRRVDVAQIHVLLDSKTGVPWSVKLEVGVRFCVEISIKERIVDEGGSFLPEHQRPLKAARDNSSEE